MRKTHSHLGSFLQNWINARLMIYKSTPKRAINKIHKDLYPAICGCLDSVEWNGWNGGMDWNNELYTC